MHFTHLEKRTVSQQLASTIKHTNNIISGNTWSHGHHKYGKYIIVNSRRKNYLEVQSLLHREGHQSIGTWPKIPCQTEKKGSPRDLIV